MSGEERRVDEERSGRVRRGANVSVSVGMCVDVTMHRLEYSKPSRQLLLHAVSSTPHLAPIDSYPILPLRERERLNKG